MWEWIFVGLVISLVAWLLVERMERKHHDRRLEKIRKRIEKREARSADKLRNDR